MDESTFKKVNSKANMMCTECGYIWKTSPHYLFTRGLFTEGKGCPQCNHKITPTAHEVNERIIKESKGKLKMDESTFTKCSHPALVECDKGHKTWVVPLQIYSSKHIKCSVCVKLSMEVPVIDALNKKNVLFKNDKALEGSNYNGSLYPLRADFRFDKYPIIIETDGRQHFISEKGINKHELEETQARDLWKNKWCKEHGYILIRVTSSPTHEWGTDRHITLKELLDLIEKYITEDGVVDIEAFRPYDFNRN